MNLYLLKKADGTEYGPLTADAVRQCILHGQAFARTMAKVDGTAGWQELSQIPEFSEALQAAAANPRTEPSAQTVLPVAPGEGPAWSPLVCDWAERSYKCGVWAVGLLLALVLIFYLMRIAGPKTLGTTLGIIGLLAVVAAPVLGLTAVASAAIAWRKIGRSAVPLSGRARAALGGILGLMPFLVFAIVLPNFLKARATAGPTVCINNLRLIVAAKEEWGVEHRKTGTETPTFEDLVGTDKYIKFQPWCPANGTYTIGNLTTKPTCSIPGHILP